MRALLLSAGKATRLGELSKTTPKCLHRIGDEVLLDRIVRQLQEAGAQEFLINTHHLSEQIEEHVNQAPWREAATLVYEPELLGTLGTLRANLDYFGQGPAWVLHADNFIQSSLAPFREAFEKRYDTCVGTILTFESANPTSCGIVSTNNQGVVVAFHEKIDDPPCRQASAATFLFDARALELVATSKVAKGDLSRDLLPSLTGRLLAVPAHGSVIDIGTPDGLSQAQAVASIGA